MPIDDYDIVERLFLMDIILPPGPRHLIFWHIQTDHTFGGLETRRKLCPQLFEVGSNVINDPHYLHLNISCSQKLRKHFPGIKVKTIEQINTFATSPTLYLVNDRSQLTGDDVLGNTYSELVDIILLRIFPGNPTGPYQIYSIQELIMTFLMYHEFIDPHDAPNQFSISEIRRLDYLLSNVEQTNVQAACLIDVIDSVYSGALRRSHLIESMKQYVEDHPEFAKDFFYQLLYIGFKMRGWSGEGEYPLRSIDTSGTIDFDDLQDDILEFRVGIGEDHRLGDLPIFLYRNKFEMSSSENHGYSITERVDIVLKNEDNNACIRLTSNWFLATSWYYLDMYFGEQPFDITEADYIT